MTKFSDLKCCPFCGGQEFYEKRYARGSVWFFMGFDGKEADNSEMYSQLSYEGSGRVYCAECDRVLGNMDKNTVTEAVSRLVEVQE